MGGLHFSQCINTIDTEKYILWSLFPPSNPTPKKLRKLMGKILQALIV